MSTNNKWDEQQKEWYEQQKKRREEHPLNAIAPTVRSSFAEWKEHFLGLDDTHEMIGALHALLDIFYIDENGHRVCLNQFGIGREVIMFLLTLADGYSDAQHFNTSGQRIDGHGPYRCREIAKKALSLLCWVFFGYKEGERNSEKRPLWLPYLIKGDIELFEKVCWFFTIDRSFNYELGIANCGSRYESVKEREIVRCFISEFARLGWDARSFVSRYGSDRERLSEKMESYLISKRPYFVELLHVLRETRWLIGRVDDDDACLEKLREMAMNGRYNLSGITVGERSDGYRCAISVEEAVFGGSATAEVVMITEMRRKLIALHRQERESVEKARSAIARRNEAEEIQKQIDELQKLRDELGKSVS